MKLRSRVIIDSILLVFAIALFVAFWAGLDSLAEPVGGAYYGTEWLGGTGK